MGRKVIIAGAGLAGLRAASALIDRGYDVTVIERAPMAGGCTSSWQDHRDPLGGTNRKGMMQMNFPFYENLNYFAWRELFAGQMHGVLAGGPTQGWWNCDSRAFSAKNSGFYFCDEHGRHTHLSHVPQSRIGRLLSRLPAPFSALQVLWDFNGLFDHQFG